MKKNAPGKSCLHLCVNFETVGNALNLKLIVVGATSVYRIRVRARGNCTKSSKFLTPPKCQPNFTTRTVSQWDGRCASTVGDKIFVHDATGEVVAGAIVLKYGGNNGKAIDFSYFRPTFFSVQAHGKQNKAPAKNTVCDKKRQYRGGRTFSTQQRKGCFVNFVEISFLVRVLLRLSSLKF